MNKYTILLLFLVLMSSISQVLLKISANKNYNSRLKEFINPVVIVAYSIFFTAMVATTVCLKHIEFKMLPIIESVGYIYILLLSKIILKEKIRPKKVIGNIIIVLGIIIFNL